MSEPAVRLEEFGLTSLKIEWHGPTPEGQDQKSDLNIGYRVGVLHDDARQYRLTLTVRDTRLGADGNSLATIEATMVGFFTFPDGTPDTDRGKIIRINGLTMLYGALRGALGTVSGLFPPGFRYVLPSVNMLDIIKNVEGKNSRKARKAQPRSTRPKRGPTATKTAAAKKKRQ